MDRSNGYEAVAVEFLARRGSGRSTGIGVREVRAWARTLRNGAAVIDLGCGPGFPITELLIAEGLDVFALDAAPSFVQAFRRNFPQTPVACEAVQDSPFFGRTFDAVLAWGLLFLLSAEDQRRLLQRVAEILVPGGRLLFTSPAEPVVWNDAMTGLESRSLGAQEYRRQLSALGLLVMSEYEDEGQNHYFDAFKVPLPAGVKTLEWLLHSDPAIRWQVLRDLVDAPAEVIAKERARVAAEGWGARLLALQDEDGQWAGGACFPARHLYDDDGSPGQPWISTLPTLQLLHDFGVDANSEWVRKAVALVRNHCRWEHAGQPFFDGEVEPCINGRTVMLGVYFHQDVKPIVARLLREQLEDGGWNCEAERGSVRSSFHTTINVLEGLLAYERATGNSAGVLQARRRAEEYLLDRNLFRRKSTGQIIDPAWLQFSFPAYWHYDVLRALDYFRSVGDKPDARLEEAIALLRSKRQRDGTWLLENTHPGKVHFPLEAGDGQPSRCNTLRALRILRWYEAFAGSNGRQN